MLTYTKRIKRQSLVKDRIFHVIFVERTVGIVETTKFIDHVFVEASASRTIDHDGDIRQALYLDSSGETTGSSFSVHDISASTIIRVSINRIRLLIVLLV